MRASTSSFLLSAAVFVAAWGVVLGTAATARAIPLPTTCVAPRDCDVGEQCLILDRVARGVCMPTVCGTGDTGTLRSGCFGVGDDLAEAFANGDCDGDLITNADERDAGVCGGAAVIALEPTIGFRWVEPARLDVGSAMIAPYDATSSVPYAIGIGCTPTRRCPALSEPSLSARCVLVIPGEDGAEPRGVCTYYTDDRDDDSCLLSIADTNACLSGVAEPPHAQWEHGDCDLDGLQNKADHDVCGRLEVMGRFSGGEVRCVPGAVQGACFGGVGEVASSTYGCALDDLDDFAPFAYCCRSHEDCPAPMYLGDPSRGRCVFLGSDAMTEQVGACTYDAAGLPDDDSCVGATPALAAACLSSSDVSYTSWANGNCDTCDSHPNDGDEVVCGSCEELDAGVNLQTDAGSAVTEDGAIASLDASTTDANAPDAATPPQVSFAGSGCRCEIASRTTPSPLLALFVWVVLAPPLLGRRKR